MIPVENIYFLLCYAWDRFDEGDMADVSSESFKDAADLLAYVLCKGVGRLLRKGLDRGYVEQEEILSTIRGRIDIGYTGRQGLHKRGRALCRFDELEYDVLHNQIIKSTLGRLIRLEGLDGKIAKRVSGLYRRLSDVREIPLTTSIFKRVTIHRNNRYYRFLLHVCELIIAYTSPNEQNGGYRFHQFLRDERRMAYVFQQFVMNFLAKEQAAYSVKAEQLDWFAEAIDEGREGDLGFLPAMLTDVSLRSPERTIIIDTKYYQDVLSTKYAGSPKVNSSNLYQINSYLGSLENCGFPDCEAEGVLLYPTNGYDVDLAWKIRGHTVRVRTLDLAQHWRDIRRQLLDIIGIRERESGCA